MDNLPELKKQAKYLPGLPGCYLFKDESGTVLYVGKAKVLKNRVGQYFGHDKRPQLPFLIQEAKKLDYIVAHNELESLYLENTLIKKHRPKYNIKLKDDKNYAFISINFQSQIPQIGYSRSITSSNSQDFTNPAASWGSVQNSKFKIQNSKFFGPYSSVKKIKDILELTRNIFPYCSNTVISDRPCFYYHLHRCPGVCIGKVSLKEYEENLNKIKLFLNGKFGEVKKLLTKNMRAEAKKKNFEIAGRLRDQLKSLQNLEYRQSVQFTKPVSYDFISSANIGVLVCINLLKIREGKLVDKEDFTLTTPSTKEVENNHQPNAKVLQTFAEQYYSDATDIPNTIYIEQKLPNQNLLTKLLRAKNHKNIEISTPKKGKVKKLLDLSKLNAQEFLRKTEANDAEDRDKINNALKILQEVLKLPSLPKRIECYDISNIQGTNPVASMVVFENGKPAKSEYRKFKIQTKDTPDDFTMMHETISRRLKHLENFESRTENLEESQSTANEVLEPKVAKWSTPDLIVIDGGKGQLSVALKAQQKHQQTNSKLQNQTQKGIRMIGLAKRIEEIFLPGKKEPIVLPHDNPALQLLQRLRDEAHRFAITFHKARRSKSATRSALDEITGIGPKTKKLLKQHFGNLAEIKKASHEELATVVGKNKAKLLLSLLG